MDPCIGTPTVSLRLPSTILPAERLLARALVARRQSGRSVPFLQRRSERSTELWSWFMELYWEECIGKSLGYAEMHIIMAKLLWHCDVATAPGERDDEWLMQKSYAMMEKLPFDVQLRYAGEIVL